MSDATKQNQSSLGPSRPLGRLAWESNHSHSHQQQSCDDLLFLNKYSELDNGLPAGFELETLDGKYILDPDGGAGAPLLFYGYLPEDARLRYMWNPKNSASISAFLDDLPADMHVLFVSYSSKPPSVSGQGFLQNRQDLGCRPSETCLLPAWSGSARS